MRTAKTNAELTSNGLCHGCNLNQELKIRQLAKFTPVNANREEEELEKYRKYLERTYKLCRRCEAHLHQTLGEQSSWLKPKLLAFRLEMNRQTAKSAQLIREAASLRFSANAAVLVWLTVVGMSVIIFFDPSICVEATSATIAVVFVAAITRQVEMSVSRVVSLICLVLLEILALTNRRGLLRQEFQDIIRSLLIVNTVITSITTFGGKGRITQKTEKRAKGRSDHDSFPEETYRMENHMDLSADKEEETMRQEERPSKLNSSTSTQRTAATSANLDEQLLFHPDRELHLRPSSQLSCNGSVVAGSVMSRPPFVSSSPAPSPAPSVCSFSAALPRPPSVAFSSRRNSSRNSENSRCDISTLSLEDAEERAAATSLLGPPASVAGGRSSAFSTRTYDAFNSSGIDFGGLRSGAPRQRRGPFKLQPANKQLKNWVAGGYWQAPSSLSGLRGREDNLSRASSQTSGFVSEGAGKEVALPPQFLMHSASRSCSRASSASSGDTSIDRLTQEAFAELRPKAESSPIEKPMGKGTSPLEPWLERRISLNCSLYSLLLAVSVGANLALAVYFISS